MKKLKEQSIVRLRAFTLIELLVVIAIIAILAALIVPLAGIAGAKQRINRGKTELKALETVIDDYKSKRGHYPPDNPVDPARPQLFYELTGTVYQDTAPTHTFRRIHGTEVINQGGFVTAFGNGPDRVEGFVNCSYVENWDNKTQLQAAEAQDFFQGLKAAQYATNAGGVALLGLPIDGPNDITTPDGRRLNPWNYVSSNPTNNPTTYDLWIDLVLKGKTNRICNWSDAPIVLN